MSLRVVRQGDIIYMKPFDELIEVISGVEIQGRHMIQHWRDKRPEQVDTKTCSRSDAWIIFKYGVKLGTTRKKKRKADEMES